MSYEVEYYELPDGSRPAEEFILAQDVKMQAKIFMALEFLEEKGPMLREPFSKPLGEGIFEVRAKQGTDISRVLYFFVVGKKVILTNGFVKKTQKTPPREIEKAKRYRADHQQREESGTMGKNFRETLNEQMKDPEFRAEWEAQEPERQIMHAILEGRQNCNLTQEQLAQVTGINQANISRLENGTANPSLRTLKRLAEGMGMELKLEFVPHVQPQH